MQVVITAVGPDNRGLADPIIHYVTGVGANIAEIQMYDHDEESLFAMLLRIDLPDGALGRTARGDGRNRQAKSRLSVRGLVARRAGRQPAAGHLHHLSGPSRPWPLLRAIRDGRIKAEAAVMLGNRPNCRSLAEQFGVAWHRVGDERGVADDER